MLVLRLWVALVVDHYLQMYVLGVMGGCVVDRQLARLLYVLGPTMNQGYSRFL